MQFSAVFQVFILGIVVNSGLEEFEDGGLVVAQVLGDVYPVFHCFQDVFHLAELVHLLAVFFAGFDIGFGVDGYNLPGNIYHLRVNNIQQAIIFHLQCLFFCLLEEMVGYAVIIFTVKIVA